MVKDKSHHSGWSPGRRNVCHHCDPSAPVGRPSVCPDAPRTHVDSPQARELRDTRPESSDSSSNHCTVVGRVSLMRTQTCYLASALERALRVRSVESGAAAGTTSRRSGTLRGSWSIAPHALSSAPGNCPLLLLPGVAGHTSWGFPWNYNRFASRAEVALSTARALGFF